MSGAKERPRCRGRIAALGLRLAGTDDLGVAIVVTATGERIDVSEGMLTQLREQAAQS